MDRESVIRKVRGLLNLAADNSAHDGEISAAMKLAEKLMNEHHVSRADAEACRVESRAAEKQAIAKAATLGSGYSTWEFRLASVICELVGTVKWFYNNGDHGQTTFGRACKWLSFYGVEEDAQIASTLHAEWALVISTLATGRHGSCFRGDGARYSLGFVQGMEEKVAEIVRQRFDIPAGQAIVLRNTTLAKWCSQKRELARQWLEEEMGRKLSRGGGSGRYTGGTRDAQEQGRADGRRADISVTRTKKLN